MLNGLDLFSGIGGISLALKPWVRTVAYCEADRYAQAVLLSRMRSGELCHAPIWDDVRTLRGDSLGNWIDIVFGGFPCQDISVAGAGGGLEGKRSGLFHELARIVEETSPTFVFVENVPAIRTRGLARVCYELARLGFDFRWTTVSAQDVGAPHLRRRWFGLAAHAQRLKLRLESGWSGWEGWEGSSFASELSPKGVTPDAHSLRELQPRGSVGKLGGWACDASWWSSEPDVERVVYGVPFGDDRNRCLGNAVVPASAREAFKRLAGINRT